MNKWYFAPGNHADKEGFTDSGIESFNADFQKHTARECVQNILDQRASNKPAKAHFKLVSVPIKDAIPNSLEFENILRDNYSYYIDDEKASRFLKKSLKVIKKTHIDVLIISDYETHGLKGLSKEGKEADHTQWDNLILRRGSSKKEGVGGGTYGIGKHAPFGLSSLRTVMYYTETTDNEKGYIWNTILGCHGNPLKAARGKFCNFNEDLHNPVQAIRDIDKRPSFITRTEPGTDVCIIGYTKDESSKNPWNVKFHKELLNNYFAAIYDKELIIEFSDLTIKQPRNYKIDHSNIFDFMKNLDNFEFLETYANPDKKFTENLKDLGYCHLYIKFNDSYSKKISYMRKPKMFVYDDSNGLVNRPYAGLFLCKDNKGDKHLRELEGPSHSDWKSKRHHDKTKGLSVLTRLNKWINRNLQTLRSEMFEESSFLEGLEKFLGYNDNSEGKNNDADSLDLENLKTEWEELKSKPTKQLTIKKPKKRTKGGKNDAGLDDGKGMGGSKGGGKGGGDRPGTSGFGDLDGGNEGEYQFKKIPENNYTFKCYTSNDSDTYKLKLNINKENELKFSINFFERGLDKEHNKPLLIKSAKDHNQEDCSFTKHQLNNVELNDNINTFDIEFTTKIKQSVNIEIYG